MLEWIAFESVEGPILVHERVDVGAALTAFVVAKSQGAKRARFADFLPKWDQGKPVQQQSAEQLRQVMEAMASLPSQLSSST